MKWSIGKILRTVWVIAGISFLIWMFVSMNARGVGNDVFTDNAALQVVRTKDFISFTPTQSYTDVVIFYPGALVDPDAYAPLCRKLAENGFQVLLMQMPRRMATQGYTKIKELNLLGDSGKQYILAGHSQGGKMAAQFVYENPNTIDKLILLGTTHPRDIDLSTAQIPVLKISGSNDGVAPPERVLENKAMLPATTDYVTIAGANHSQFGYYGFQLGDSQARISREEQQRLILDTMLPFITSN